MRKLLLTLFGLTALFLKAQTETDGLFMAKRNLCGGFIYGHSSWNKYWEGTFFRNNANIGTVTSDMVMGMANYGITSRTNIIASAMWVSNRASAGTLKGMKGLQDLNLFLKQELMAQNISGFNTSIVAVAGVSAPLTNYVADYLPLSIGLRSKTASLRLLTDVQKGHWYGTASAAYMRRGKVSIDRNAYYTTEMVYSNIVAMPDMFMYNLRFGWRDGSDKYAELVVDRMNTLGGFDMRKNDMPFLLNNMEAFRVGLNVKCPIPKTNGLSFVANGMNTLVGRNMGKATSIMAGFVYQAEFRKGKKQ
jgi:hypothetical protein